MLHHGIARPLARRSPQADRVTAGNRQLRASHRADADRARIHDDLSHQFSKRLPAVCDHRNGVWAPAASKSGLGLSHCLRRSVGVRTKDERATG